MLPREVKGLKAAGLLKEEKGKTKTKEEKGKTETKLDAEGPKLDNEEKTDDNQGEPEKKEEPAPPKNRPVNISINNIKQGATK